jgi:PAS domain S-box-containing protein
MSRPAEPTGPSSPSRSTEDASASEREQLRITLASIGDGVISTDAAGRVVFLNGVAEGLTGWPLADARGRPLEDVFRIVHEHTREPVENPALLALREGRAVALANHTLLIARDGTERPIDDTAAPIRDEAGATSGAVLVFRDVTDRRRAAETRARLAAIVESSDDAIVSKTLDGVIRSWNAGAERLFGYTAAEAVGQSITLIIPPDRIDEEREIISRLRRGERIDHYETVRVAKDGRLLDVSLTVSPLRDAAGRVVGASKIARDISARKAADSETARLYEQLQEQDKRKDDFLALLAHELRNPLAPLRNGLQALALAGHNPVAVGQVREMMDRQFTHLVRLVDDLLDVSRITRNKMELRRSRVWLADVVRTAVETARPLIDAAGHELTVTLPPEPVELDADPVRLAQVFSNLLTNSAKYTRGGGRITLEAVVRAQGSGVRGQESETAGLSSLTPDPCLLTPEVEVRVTDTGIGIPAGELPRIFDMFSQVDRSDEKNAGGLGIGLALVKGLTEMHGGTVRADSPGPDRGSTFTVRLPLPAASAEPPGQVPVAEPSRPAGSRRRRVLVVDDNRDGADSMATMLTLLGDEVHTARDGLEGVAVAERLRPDVILMDVGMPRLNGLDATRRIREQPWGREMVVIAVTGWGQAEDRERTRDAGFDAHLVKPVSLADLERLMGELRPATRTPV